MRCLILLGLAAISMEFRKAEITDAAGIAKVLIDTRRVTNRGLVPDPYLEEMSYDIDEKEFRESLSNPVENQITLVVEGVNEQIVGFANGKPTVDAPGDRSIELKELYFLPEAQRNGLGHALVSNFMTEALQRDINRVYVWVLAGNPSRRFYEKLGATFEREADRTIGGAVCKLAVYYWDEEAMKQVITGDRAAASHSQSPPASSAK